MCTVMRWNFLNFRYTPSSCYYLFISSLTFSYLKPFVGIATVVGIGPVPKQTKESVRRDKRPSCLYCVSVSCLYCIGQKHLLVGASQSTVCWPIFVSIC